MNPQQRFDESYISSTEICERLQITRAGLVAARRRNVIPIQHIEINGALILLWERKAIEPFLANWQAELNARRGVVNG